MDPYNSNQPPMGGYNQPYMMHNTQYMNANNPMMQMQGFQQMNPNAQFQNVGFNQANMGYVNPQQMPPHPHQPVNHFQPRQNLRPPVASATNQVNSEEEKKQRYKLEQQRKFRNFGNNFGRTTIDTMMNNIVSSTTTTKQPSHKPQQSNTHIEDDFGDFLQANQQQPIAQHQTPSQHNQQLTSHPVINQVVTPMPSASVVDDFADFAPAVAPSPIHASTTTNTASMQPQANHLQSKMLASLDLNQPKQASHHFRSVKQPPSKRPESKILHVSSKAANWSALEVNEEEFQVVVETPVVAPVVEPPPQVEVPPTVQPSTWISNTTLAPLLYNQVLEASLGADGLIDTNKVHPILLRSQLSNETLGHLWSQANKIVPGRLNQEELFILLALIALTQGGETNPTVEMVRYLPSPPLPTLNVPPSQHYPPTSINNNQATNFGHFTSHASNNPTKTLTDGHCMVYTNPPTDSVHLKHLDDDFDDFQDFQSVTASVLPNFNTPVENTHTNFVTGNTVQPAIPQSLPQIKLETKAQNVNTTPANNLNHPASILSLTPQPTTSTETPNKYSAFNEAPTSSFFNPPTSNEIVASTNNKVSDLPDFEPPTYSSLFSRDPDIFSDTSGSLAPPSEFPATNSSPAPPSVENDDFGDFSSAKVEWKSLFTDNLAAQKNKSSSFPALPQPLKQSSVAAIKSENNLLESIEIANGEDKYAAFSDSSFSTKFDNVSTKSDQSSIKSLDMNNALSKLKSDSNSVLSFDLKNNTKFGIHTVDSEANSVRSLEFTNISDTIMQQSIGSISPKPLATNTAVKLDLYDDDDFGDFCEPPPDLPPDTNDEFDEYNGGNSALVDFDPFETFPTSSKKKKDEKSNEQVFPLSPSFQKKVDGIQSPLSPPHDKFGKNASSFTESGNTAAVVVEAPTYQNETMNGATNEKENEEKEVSNQPIETVQSVPPSKPDFTPKNLNLKDPDYFLKNSLFTPEIVKKESLEDIGGDQDSSQPHPVDDQDEKVPTTDLKPKFDASVWSNGHVVQEQVVHAVFEDNSETLTVEQSEWQLQTRQVDHVREYTEKWELCLSACLEVILQTNETLSSIASPSVCNEVLYSCKGQRFISDLSAVYQVARRICSSARKIKLEISQLKQLHKQIELSWNNLLSFCPNASANELEVVTKNESTCICGVCLLAMKGSQINYGGSSYHATCANLWLNRVASVLPALQLPQPAQA
ncbi:synergin gamma-like [Ciona intestinalis]